MSRPDHPEPIDAAHPTGTPHVLEVDGLSVSVAGGRAAVRDVSFAVAAGESVGLVGESGSGKTLTCRSVLGLLPRAADLDRGRIVLGAGTHGADGDARVDLSTARRRTWDSVRGTRLAAVFQDPASYLNPSLTVGHQVDEQLRVRGGLSRRDARARTLELLAEVGMHDPATVADQYPFQLSGGMLQRVLIAIAVSLNPQLLIADEATTALDTVVQAEILGLLRRLRRSHGLALLLVTHDLAVVAETCDRVLVMYGGEIVESGPTQEVLGDPQHPYTQALMRVASIGDWSRRTLDTIPGQPPAVGEELPGCRFAPRCPHAAPACVEAPVALRPAGGVQGGRDDRAARVARCVRVAVPA